jgi:hypothetical protein
MRGGGDGSAVNLWAYSNVEVNGQFYASIDLTSGARTLSSIVIFPLRVREFKIVGWGMTTLTESTVLQGKEGNNRPVSLLSVNECPQGQ